MGDIDAIIMENYERGFAQGYEKGRQETIDKALRLAKEMRLIRWEDSDKAVAFRKAMEK